MNDGNRGSDESVQTSGEREKISKAGKGEEIYGNQYPWGPVKPGRARQGREGPARAMKSQTGPVRAGQGQQGPARSKDGLLNPRRARQRVDGQVRKAKIAKTLLRVV